MRSTILIAIALSAMTIGVSAQAANTTAATTIPSNATVAGNTTAAAAANTTATPVTPAPGTTTAATRSRGVRTVIIGNFGPSGAAANTLPVPALPTSSDVPSQNQWSAQFAAALSAFTDVVGHSYPATGGSLIDVPVTVNTEGRLGLAVSRLIAALDAAADVPDAIIVSDAYDISLAIQATIVERYGSSVLIIMAQSSSGDVDFASKAVGPATIRTVPADAVVASRLVDTLESIAWQAFGILSSADDYGDGFVSAMDTALAAKQVPARVLARIRLSGWAAATRDADDVAAILQLATSGATGVVVAGGPGTAARILNAAARARQAYATTTPAVSSLFFIFSSAAIFDFPRMSVSAPMNHAIFVPQFTPVADFVPHYLSSAAGLTDGFGFQLSYLLDSLNVIAAAANAVAVAGTALSGQALLASATAASTVIQPYFTGSMRIGATSLNRAATNTYALVQIPSTTGASLTTIATATATGTPAVVSNGTVPSSTQSVVEVCLVGSDSCADYANVAQAVFALLDAGTGRQQPMLPTGISVVPVPLAAGTTGVRAIAAVSANAHTCDFLVGPSRTTLAVAINPIVSYYGIPTVDYGSTSPLLSDKVQYPYFSRTVPSEIMFAKAASATFKRFGWEIATILTLQNAYGATVVDEYTKALNEQATSVEKAYLIDEHDTTNSSLGTALLDIKTQLITRIVIVALPGSDAQLRMFFETVANLGMQQSHIFLFTDTLCQFTALQPQYRAPLVGSLCVLPQFTTNPVVPPDTAAAVSLLAGGGFDTTTCTLQHTDMYSPFARDAANVVVDTIYRMVTANGGTMRDATNPARTIFNNGTAVVQAIRATSLRNGLTGTVKFLANGNRASEAFTLQIQQFAGLVEFGSWSDSIGFRPDADAPQLVWAGNTTETPKASTRTMSFIVAKTAQQNPAVIAISVLGFIATIGLLVMCCKFQLKKRDEAAATEGRAAAAVVPGSHAVEMSGKK